MTNPLLSRWDTPFEIAPFASISDADFASALEQALAAHNAAIDAIAADTAAPGFDNVVGALETPCRELEQVLGVFFTVAGADKVRELIVKRLQFGHLLFDLFQLAFGN